MAVTRLKNADFRTLPVGSLLDIREAAQATLATADPKSADYKNARANLTNINKEIGRDLGIGSNAAKLDDTQIANVSNARNNFQSTVTLEGVPASVQNAVNKSLNTNIRQDESRQLGVVNSERRSLDVQLQADGVPAAARKEILQEFDADKKVLQTNLAAPGRQNVLSESGYYIPNISVAAAQPTIEKLNVGRNFAQQYGFQPHSRTGDHSSQGLLSAHGYTLSQAAADGNVTREELGNPGPGAFAFAKGGGRALETWQNISSTFEAPITLPNGSTIVLPKGLLETEIKGQLTPIGENAFTSRIEEGNGRTLTQTFIRGGFVNGEFVAGAGDRYYNVSNATSVVNERAGLAGLGILPDIIAAGIGFINPLAGAAASGLNTALRGGDFGDILQSAALAYFGQKAGDFLFKGAGGVTGFFDDVAALADDIANPAAALTRVGGTLTNLPDDFLRSLKNLPNIPSQIATRVDELLTSRGVSTVASSADNIAAGSSGLLDDATAANLDTGINNVRGGVMNQVNPNVQTNVPGTGFFSDGRPITPGGYGLTSPSPGVSEAIQDILRDVSFANADEVAEAAQIIANYSGDTVTLIGPGGVPFTRSPIPLDVSVTGAEGANVPVPPPPIPTVPTPLPTVPAPVPAPTPAPIEDRSQPVVPTPNPSLLDTAGNVVDIAREYLPPLVIAGSLLNREPVPTGVGDNKLPAWALDPAMSAVIPRIQAAQAAMPAPMPNLFNAQFQRGGLGAGQFIGYDLLNRTGDIPQQTLLGVSPLAMPPLNLLGVTGGQVPASQTSLVG